MEDLIKSRKYNALLDTSRMLFWKYGFRRVTIDEICREAKTSKMTFYRFFPNKLEIARTVLDHVFDKSLKDFRIIMREDISVSEKMNKILLMKLDGTNDISNEFLQDFYNNPELGLTHYIEERSRIYLERNYKRFQNRTGRGLDQKRS